MASGATIENYSFLFLLSFDERVTRKATLKLILINTGRSISCDVCLLPLRIKILMGQRGSWYKNSCRKARTPHVGLHLWFLLFLFRLQVSDLRTQSGGLIPGVYELVAP